MFFYYYGYLVSVANIQPLHSREKELMDINELMGRSVFQEMLFTKAGGRSDLVNRLLADSSIPHRLWQFQVCRQYSAKKLLN